MKVSCRPVFLCDSVHFVHKILLLTCVLLDLKRKITKSANEATPPAGSTVASRCPFLTAENRMVRQASKELQEDIQEMDFRCKGEQPRTCLLYMTDKLQKL